ncbi:MAG: hypothetical protein HRT35_18045 [Algicola sp.]|nr:hypothetical protein [Algicola sp.]
MNKNTLLAGLAALAGMFGQTAVAVEVAKVSDFKRLSYNIDRSKQGLENARYVVDLSQWPTSVTSWCEGEKLYNLPFCGGKKEDDQNRTISKQVTFAPDKRHAPTHLQVDAVVQWQNDKVLRTHNINYRDDHKRIKASLKSKAGNGALLSKANIISDQPITLITLEAMLLNVMSGKSFKSADNLHWFEPKRSKRMKWVYVGPDSPSIKGNYPKAKADKWTVNHYNPHNGAQTEMFTVYFNQRGLPLVVQANSGKWVMALDKVIENNQRKTALQIW